MQFTEEELSVSKVDKFVANVSIHAYVRDVYNWLVIRFTVEDTLKLLGRFLPLLRRS